MGSGVLSCSSSLINNGSGFPFIASYRATVNTGETFGKISDEGCKGLRFNPYLIACINLLADEIIYVGGLNDVEEVLSFFVVERDRDGVHCTFIDVWIC